MMFLKALLALCFACLGVAQRPGWNPRFLNKETMGHPAFMNIYRSEDQSLEYEDQFTMYISTFDPLLVGTRDQVWYMRSPGRYLNDVLGWRGNQLVVMDQSALWANDMDYVPSGVSGDSAEGIIQTSGFLVTGRQDGQLQYYDTTIEPPGPDGGINIAALDVGQWSYHRVIWMDMDNDGDDDALTARFEVGLLGGTTTAFLWYENVGTGFFAGWPEHIIAEGPDVHFDVVNQEVAGRNYTVVVVGEFWNRRVSLWWTENADEDWTDTANINSRVIWENDGQVFDVLVGDYNKDGVDEFTITEFYANENNGVFRFFFFPSDFRTEEFSTSIIAQGFQAPESGIFAEYMTPGTPMMYYPTLEDSQAVASDGLPLKPYLLLSGDDDGCFYVFTPTDDEARQDFSYDQHILVNTSLSDNLRTVGKMDTADLDGDGYEEVILAAYDEDALYVYTYCDIDCGY